VLYLSQFINTHKKYTHVLLSLHGNAASDTSAAGFEFFSTPGITDSDYAANYYFPYMYDLGLKMRVNRAKEGEFDKESNFYIIRKAESLGCIALLFESGFYTNREEALKMMEQEWQLTYVNALYKGTRDLIEKIKKDGTVR
jgi:N-acetylmuramoyl-L-alanine amidase